MLQDSVELQVFGNELSGAIESHDSCQKVKQDNRNYENLEYLFAKIETKLDREIEELLVNRRQTQLPNAPTTTTMDNYRVSWFLPFVDAII